MGLFIDVLWENTWNKLPAACSAIPKWNKWVELALYKAMFELSLNTVNSVLSGTDCICVHVCMAWDKQQRLSWDLPYRIKPVALSFQFHPSKNFSAFWGRSGVVSILPSFLSDKWLQGFSIKWHCGGRMCSGSLPHSLHMWPGYCNTSPCTVSLAFPSLLLLQGQMPWKTTCGRASQLLQLLKT